MEKILLGTIVKPQGVKGEMKIMPADKNVDIFKSVNQIYLNNQTNPISVKSLVFRQGFGYLTLDGVKDRNQAENYRNTEIYINKQDAKMSESTYFIEDLVSSEIFSETGEFLGTVLDIENYGATDIICVLDKDNREFDVPFLSSIVVDVQIGKLIVNKQKFYEVNNCV